LLEYYTLLTGGIPLPAAVLLTTHYNATRSEYYRQLDRASKSGGDLIPFIHYAVFSPGVSLAYGSKSEKTVTRDINALLKDGLTLRSPDGFEANEALMRAFLPLRFISETGSTGGPAD